MIRIIFFCFVIFLIQINGLRRRCINTGVLFPDKILRSSIVIYGESLGKRIYVETDTELLFNITFRVDCIFKGYDIENRIEITDAGIKTGRMACQWLDPGRFYIVFLEKCGLNTTTYCALDFQERLVDDITYELLEKTCHLTRLSPLHSLSNHCPNVSMTEFCPNDDIDIKIIPRSKNFDDKNSNMKISFNHGNQFYLQSNITIPNDSSSNKQIADQSYNHANLSTYISIQILIFAVYIAIFI